MRKLAFATPSFLQVFPHLFIAAKSNGSETYSDDSMNLLHENQCLKKQLLLAES